jgi:hypothetical protein
MAASRGSCLNCVQGATRRLCRADFGNSEHSAGLD